MGGAVVAIIIRREKDLVEHMHLQNALSPATARSFNDLHIEDERTLRRLRNAAVIREASPGLYYLDAEVWRAYNGGRRRRVFIFVGIVLVIPILLILLMNFAGSGQPPEIPAQ